MIEKFSILYVLHNEVELFWRLNDLVELDDVGMPD